MIEARELGRVIQRVGASDVLARQALGSTLRKLASWVRSRSTKDLSKALRVQQKIIRRRVATTRLRRAPSGARISIWYGLNPIALIHLGAKQNRQGLLAMGGRTVRSGFIATGKRGSLQAFKRKGKGRLPLKRQTVEIERESSAYIRHDLLDEGEFRSRFLRTFEHEMRWRMHRQ